MTNDLFLRACKGEVTERTPVWMMRQAGRFLAEYREVRKKHDFWTVCRTPELATKVTMQPIDAVKPDAAILFSDILTVLPPLGLEVVFTPGPEIAMPVRSSADIDKLHSFDVLKEVGFVYDALRQIKTALAGRANLIGFGGAPLTLAAYMVEGGKSRNFENLKCLFYDQPQAATRLFDLLVEVQTQYLSEQVNAGAEVIQIFDTWAGSMPRGIVEAFVIPSVTKLVANVKKTGVPVIYFMKDAAHVLDLLASTGADVLSVDEKLPLHMVAKAIGDGPALQGNFDSALLFGSKELISQKVGEVLASVPDGRPHIFNLGHGILPATPVENAIHLVAEVKRQSQRG